MDIFAGIKTYIFMLSGCVLYPALILLAGMSVWIFYECGKLLADWIGRQRLPPGGEPFPLSAYHHALCELLQHSPVEADVQNLLRKSIQRRQSMLDKYRIAVRAGPALGLIGTLVPMGTALASLGQGDLSVMTSELVLAYTTTVVGLVTGSLAHVICIVRRRFAESDIREMEYLTEKLCHEIYA